MTDTARVRGEPRSRDDMKSAVTTIRSLALRLTCFAGVAFFASACGGPAVDMNVVVFNYWPRPLADVYVDGQHVGAGFGANGPGGTGGSISCCHRVRTGSIKVAWMLDGPPDDPLTGTTSSTVVDLDAIQPGARYLGVYLYPDGSAALGTAKGLPGDRWPQEGK